MPVSESKRSARHSKREITQRLVEWLRKEDALTWGLKGPHFFEHLLD
jgi:hypothetical protein